VLQLCSQAPWSNPIGKSVAMQIPTGKKEILCSNHTTSRRFIQLLGLKKIE
jgi:hypothetical protein